MSATPYGIVRTRYFYHAPHERRERYGGSHATWPTLKEARQEIARLNSGVYYQAHDEYGRAEYFAARVDRLPQYLL